MRLPGDFIGADPHEAEGLARTTSPYRAAHAARGDVVWVARAGCVKARAPVMDGISGWELWLLLLVLYGPSLLCLACAVDAARRPLDQWNSISESRWRTVALMCGSAVLGALSVFAAGWYLVLQRRRLK